MLSIADNDSISEKRCDGFMALSFLIVGNGIMRGNIQKFCLNDHSRLNTLQVRLVVTTCAVPFLAGMIGLDHTSILPPIAFCIFSDYILEPPATALSVNYQENQTVILTGPRSELWSFGLTRLEPAVLKWRGRLSPGVWRKTSLC